MAGRVRGGSEDLGRCVGAGLAGDGLETSGRGRGAAGRAAGGTAAAGRETWTGALGAATGTATG